MLRKLESFMKGKVHKLPPTASVVDAARLMARKGCASVVVSSKGRLEGIFTSGDLVKRVVAVSRSPARTRLGAVMTRQPDTVGAATLALDALRMMQAGHYRHLPVMDGQRIIGIVSRRDFFGQEEAIIEDGNRLSEVMR